MHDKWHDNMNIEADGASDCSIRFKENIEILNVCIHMLSL